MAAVTNTNVKVQVIAAGGKYLGDDIGGAAIVIRDADSRQVLAQNTTSGNSGPGDVMCTPQTSRLPIPTNAAASAYTAVLPLTQPTKIEVTAFGPLGARGSANSATKTTWVYPGLDITTGNGILLELDGLITQVVTPPTHTVFQSSVQGLKIVTNIAMMCGCPISTKADGAVCPGSPGANQPWPDSDFNVYASIPQVSAQAMNLTWDTTCGVAGRFISEAFDIPQPATTTSYQITVYAQQISTGNTGVDISTFIINGSSS